MKNTFKAAAAAALLACAGASHATPIGTITHFYGGAYPASTGGTSCDTLNIQSITVTNKTNCSRFLDSFNFSTMAYSAIDSFTLSMTFSGTNNLFENWGVRPASSAFNGSSVQPTMTKSGDAVSQSFTITNLSNPDVFNAIVAGGTFYLWFASNGLGQQSFLLNSATVTVNGTAAVPEPASLALLGIAALGIGAARRKRHA